MKYALIVNNRGQTTINTETSSKLWSDPNYFQKNNRGQTTINPHALPP